ncbi:Elongator complex protein 2 [Seminavis robusta]|uniref:Elongator complex protein 2 n=1 Tax=Seminavis robusta TaxID=568900 RepID=A0A9N8ENQ6_9STRA|nr:Elongator complex protein 2 [Seminavis robusta]|eukprot:Sro1444_g273240.1 Elongator complex protein 2 (946) ;mRNA; f:12440-15277
MSSSSSSTNTSSNGCQLVHHGAAVTSSTKVLTWLPSSGNDTPTIAFASHAMINVARPVAVRFPRDKQQEQQEEEKQEQQEKQDDEWIWNVQETLRTTLCYSVSPTAKVPTITALSYVKPVATDTTTTDSNSSTLAAGFSNGSLSVWTKQDETNQEWNETVWMDAIATAKDSTTSEAPRSITDIQGIRLPHNHTIWLAACSSAGVTHHSYQNDNKTHRSSLVTHHTASTVQWESLSDSTLLLLIGTAAPRHNKIMIYSIPIPASTTTDNHPFHYCGALTGHEDWIGCLAWQQTLSSSPENGSYMLASGSQDWKIRLWKFTTTAVKAEIITTTTTNEEDQDENLEDDDEVDVEDEEDFEEHESRMDILWHDEQQPYQTSVSLEALLLGHEGPVTAVEWYPSQSSEQLSSQQSSSSILLSSSMDRSIYLWSPSQDDGIWTPVTRVGSAGGILGGSVGSTLLGYLNVLIQPPWLMGHAYGGALHIWHSSNNNPHFWNATPCLTGHFDGITDLCWESTFGEYLLTVSLDQTCRLWAPLQTNSTNNNKKSAWVEVARPQVHGYNLSAITSLSSPDHRHWIVSGADEKELRILDAPMTTVRILQAISGTNDSSSNKENIDRVERAYIPSLGLSNKATAADGAEEDVHGIDDDNNNNASRTVNLPLERDLGALSLWLETRKLFGHNTELYCVTSTLEAKTAAMLGKQDDDVLLLVASTTKARDVDAAAIRIWNPQNGECVQVLSGGHKSTVATMSFSPDGGKYLASAGKDRRLCVWKRSSDGNQYHLAAAKDTAHKRIIWSVHFCPYDSTILASGSRDGNIKIWKLSDKDDELTMEPLFSFAPATQNHAQKPDSVTALALAPRPLPQNNHALLAIGLESGLMELWSIPIDSSATEDAAPQLIQCLPGSMCHVATVTKLTWRPLRNENSDVLTLASGSTDHGCRVFEIETSSLL